MVIFNGLAFNLRKGSFLMTSFVWLVLFASLAIGQAPSPASSLGLHIFSAEYEARYRGFRAKASRSLAEENQQYIMSSRVELKLLGKSISSISEESNFTIENGNILSKQYSFIQTGIGGRSRNQSFNWQDNIVNAQIDDNSFQATSSPHLLDALNAYEFLKHKIADGHDSITVTVFDKDKIEEQLYQVIGNEVIETKLGFFNAIKIERIRDPASKRSTTLWLATDWNNLLIKLEQIDENNKKLELSIANAMVNEKALTPLNEN